jgi:hypothetical protein
MDSFISAFLALFAAAVGGRLGAAQIHRVYHPRKYPARPFALTINTERWTEKGRSIDRPFFVSFART